MTFLRVTLCEKSVYNLPLKERLRARRENEETKICLLLRLALFSAEEVNSRAHRTGKAALRFNVLRGVNFERLYYHMSD